MEVIDSSDQSLTDFSPQKVWSLWKFHRSQQCECSAGRLIIWSLKRAIRAVLFLVIDHWSLIRMTVCVLLLSQYSDLELALNTLVTEFHKAADDGPTMNTTQFQTMISNQLPSFAKVGPWHHNSASNHNTLLSLVMSPQGKFICIAQLRHKVLYRHKLH